MNPTEIEAVQALVGVRVPRFLLTAKHRAGEGEGLHAQNKGNTDRISIIMCNVSELPNVKLQSKQSKRVV